MGSARRRKLDAGNIPHAVPNALGDLDWQLAALQLLVDQPHSNHEFLFRQKPDLPVIHEIPHLFQDRGWQSAAGPYLAHNKV